MRPDDFYRTRIKNRELKNVTLLSGEEEYWKSIHKKLILDSLFKDNSEATMNFFSFDVSNTSITDCIAEANVFGFFGNKKVVLLKNVEKLNADDQKELINYIDKPNPDTFLLLECMSLDGRSMLSKNNVLKTESVEYKIASIKDLEDFIKSELHQLGDITCDAKLKQYLIQHYPENLRLLSNNLKKLAAYNNYVSPLTMNNIKVLNFAKNEPNNFAFVDALMQKDLKTALSLYSLFSNKKDSVFGIIGLIRKQLQTFLKAKQLQMDKISESEIIKLCGIYYKKKDFFFKALAAFRRNELKRKYKKVADTDFLLKSSSLPPHHLFEMLIYYLCA